VTAARQNWAGWTNPHLAAVVERIPGLTLFGADDRPGAVSSRVRAAVIAEIPLAVTLATALLFWLFGSGWLADLTRTAWVAFLTAWLFVVVLLAAFGVVRHADALAVHLGEPLGTLVLTLSVISIEVMMISAVMLAGSNNPTLARDTMYSVAMIVLSGLVGLCLLLGGLRHREQEYNLQGANAFLGLILPLAVLALILPRYTRSTPDATYSELQASLLVVMALGLYAAFLAVQTVRHRSFFVAPNLEAGEAAGGDHGHDDVSALRPARIHAALLTCYLLPVVLLSKKFAIPVDYAVDELGAPPALAGMVVATLVLSPEALGAIRAALANRLQRAVNIALGSVAATIGLTIPAVLAISLITHEPVVLGLNPPEAILLLPHARRVGRDLQQRAYQRAAGRCPYSALLHLPDSDLRLRRPPITID
jgi:Ca2+:H+ antiporter